MIPSTKCRDLLLPEMLGPATGPGDPRYEIPNARGVGRRDLGCLKIPHQNCRTEGVFHHHHDPCFFFQQTIIYPQKHPVQIGYKTYQKRIKKDVCSWQVDFQGWLYQMEGNLSQVLTPDRWPGSLAVQCHGPWVGGSSSGSCCWRISQEPRLEHGWMNEIIWISHQLCKFRNFCH